MQRFSPTCGVALHPLRRDRFASGEYSPVSTQRRRSELVADDPSGPDAAGEKCAEVAAEDPQRFVAGQDLKAHFVQFICTRCPARVA